MFREKIQNKMIIETFNIDDKFKKVLFYIEDNFSVKKIKQIKLDGEDTIAMYVNPTLGTKEVEEIEDKFDDFSITQNRQKRILYVQYV